MVANVKTVATQAFQIWMNEDMASLGLDDPPVTLSAFTKPFDTWADMAHVIPQENWQEPPEVSRIFLQRAGRPAGAARSRRHRLRGERTGGGAAQCHRLPQQPDPPSVAGRGQARQASSAGICWRTTRPRSEPPHGEARFDKQYWIANVNPTDRYVLMLPGTLRYRISPLDNTYDNLTIAGDWTDCGYNAGCVEAAVMSGRLAAHAIAQWPPLEDITGYDHP